MTPKADTPPPQPTALPSIRFKLLHPEAKEPFRAYGTAAGLDLAAFALTEDGRSNDIIIGPNSTRQISTGIAAEPPPHTVLWILSRSGLAKSAVFVANSPGLIDPDYRGEIIVLLYNGGHHSFRVRHGDRVAQLCLAPLIEPKFEIVERLSLTVRNERGVGSTDQ